MLRGAMNISLHPLLLYPCMATLMAHGIRAAGEVPEAPPPHTLHAVAASVRDNRRRIHLNDTCDNAVKLVGASSWMLQLQLAVRILSKQPTTTSRSRTAPHSKIDGADF